MNPSVEHILGQLEVVGANLIQLTGTSGTNQEESEAVLALVSERASLIEQLDQVLHVTSSLPDDYRARLVVIHQQGCDIANYLMTLRSNLIERISSNERGHSYLQCLTGMSTYLES